MSPYMHATAVRKVDPEDRPRRRLPRSSRCSRPRYGGSRPRNRSRGGPARGHRQHGPSLRGHGASSGGVVRGHTVRKPVIFTPPTGLLNGGWKREGVTTNGTPTTSANALPALPQEPRDGRRAAPMALPRHPKCPVIAVNQFWDAPGVP